MAACCMSLVPMCPVPPRHPPMGWAQLRAPLVAEAGLAWRRWWGGGSPGGWAVEPQSHRWLTKRNLSLRVLQQLHHLASGGAQSTAPLCLKARGAAGGCALTCDLLSSAKNPTRGVLHTS